MQSRLNYAATAPSVVQAVLGLSKASSDNGLDRELVELINLRVSQINGCAYCLDMHATALRGMGVSHRRLDLLPAWRESPGYTEREQAALAWAEAVTLPAGRGVPDDVYAAALAEFGDKGLVDLTLSVAVINTWNRLNVAFHNAPAGHGA